MAQRRMFSRTITASSRFLMMPHSTQALYFHLGMNADDDGFVEHFAIMRMVEAKPDDLKILAAKGFVRVFDEQVLVIIDWKENNYLRSDRYTQSKYLEVYNHELLTIQQDARGIPNGRQVVDERYTQDRLGKDSIGENSIGKDKEELPDSAIAPSLPKKVKHKHGEFKHVQLTDDEYAKLKTKFNGDTDAIINFLDSEKERKGYKYKSDYLTILGWVQEAYFKRNPKQETHEEYVQKRLREIGL